MREKTLASTCTIFKNWNFFYKPNDFVIPKEMEQYLKTHWDKIGWYFGIYRKVQVKENAFY